MSNHDLHYKRDPDSVMRVTIEHIAPRGFFSDGKHRVKVTVIFSEQALAIIKARSLWKSVVFDNSADFYKNFADSDGHVSGNSYTIKDLAKGGAIKMCHTAGEAQAFENELREKILPDLKQYILSNREGRQATTTFDL
jgi:hypothetical protein